jgi:hypothetical protein
MTATDAIKRVFGFTDNVFKTYLSDLSDADLLARPVPQANSIAWQLGHLINSEVMLLGDVKTAPTVELPAGFADKYSKETSAVEPTKGALTKVEYVALYDKVRAASLAKLNKCSDSDLDKPNTGRLAQFAPTIGDLFLLTANHPMMHAGQIVVLRRKLGKPILM